MGETWPQSMMFWTSQALGGVASLQEREAILQQGEWERARLRGNARIADLQARDALARGEEAVRALSREGRRMIGAQRAGLAAQGVAVGTGTAAEIQADTAAQVAIDIETVRSNAMREAWGLRVQAADYRTQGQLARQAAAYRGGVTLLGGGLEFFRRTAAYYAEPEERPWWQRMFGG